MTKPFTVIVPKTIDNSNFVSSTLTEGSNNPPYDYYRYNYNAGGLVGGGITYAAGDYVVLTSNHKIYKSLQGSNLNHPPDTSPTWWVEVGPTNRWAMFDESGGTYSYSSGANIVVSFTADRATSIALIELTARSVRIQATSPGYPNYYDQTYNMGDRAIIQNWYDYFTADSFLATELIVTDIPSIANTTFTITIENNSNPLQVGNLIVGQALELGKTQYGAKIGIVDYSKKEVNEFGKANLVKRNFSKKMDVSLSVDNQLVDAVAQRLSYLRATPCLWVGANGVFESLTVYGFYRDFSIEIPRPTSSVCSLQIEGLV